MAVTPGKIHKGPVSTQQSLLKNGSNVSNLKHMTIRIQILLYAQDSKGEDLKLQLVNSFPHAIQKTSCLVYFLRFAGTPAGNELLPQNIEMWIVQNCCLAS